MPTLKQLLPYRATLLIGLLISSSCASAGAEKHYHSGPPGQHFVVLWLVYETIDGPNVGDEKDDIIVGDGFLSSDGQLIINGLKANRVQKHLQRLDARGAALDLAENQRPVIKIFSRAHSGGLGHIRQLSNDLMERTWSGSDVVKIPFSKSVGFTERPPVKISDSDLASYKYSAYRSKDYQITYRTKNKKTVVHLTFKYEVKDAECDQNQCQSSSNKVSYKPVIAGGSGFFFLLGFTSGCSHNAQCDIIKANVEPAGLTDNKRRPGSVEAPQKSWLPSLKASIALTGIAILLIKAFLRFQPDVAPQ